jgi:predicted kinase
MIELLAAFLDLLMLYIFGGLPGTGKSTLSAALAKRCHAVYLRIDTIEQALRDGAFAADSPAGYVVGYRVAMDNLRLGKSVVADSVNPLEATRTAWRDVAAAADVPFLEIEISCSCPEEHRKRVQSRKAEAPGLRVLTWAEVCKRDYEQWTTKRIAIDTARQSPAESTARLLQAVDDGRLERLAGALVRLHS